jgi:hypothetical protein
MPRANIASNTPQRCWPVLSEIMLPAKGGPIWRTNRLSAEQHGTVIRVALTQVFLRDLYRLTSCYVDSDRAQHD